MSDGRREIAFMLVEGASHLSTLKSGCLIFRTRSHARYRLKNKHPFNLENFKAFAFILAQGAAHAGLSADKRKTAFTLAEVLITLGIIGIIAAMTLPSIMAKTREKEAVAKLKKLHVTLESAYRLAQNENADIKSWFPTDDRKANTEIFYKNLKPYLRVLKECGYGEGCLTPGYVKTLDGRNYVNYDKAVLEYRVILNDGTALMFMLSSPQCSFVYNVDGNEIKWEACGNIKVDINGLKGEYTLGKDFFIFDITPKGIYPAGMQTDSYTFENYCNVSKQTNANGRSCTAWVLYNENMEYLRCSDLSWNGKSKCN